MIEATRSCSTAAQIEKRERSAGEREGGVLFCRDRFQSTPKPDSTVQSSLYDNNRQVFAYFKQHRNGYSHKEINNNTASDGNSDGDGSEGSVSLI